MTIICYKNKKLVADGIETHHDQITSLNTDKIVLSTAADNWHILGDRIIAFAATGTVTADITLRECLTRGIGLTHSFLNVCCDDFAAVCITANGDSYIVGTAKVDGDDRIIIIDSKPHDFPLAIGSGTETARSLMHGKLDFSAKEAVEYVCENFVGCGGVIVEVDISEVATKILNTP